MAVLMRRGNQVDFNESKMLPGEWAVSMDNSKVYMCFQAGKAVEIGSVESMRVYIEDAEAWAVGERSQEPVDITDITYHNNSKYYSEVAKGHKDDADISASEAKTSETEARKSEVAANESEAHCEELWNNMDNAIQRITPTMEMDFNTGHLSYTGSFFEFTVTNTGHLEWGIAI